MAADPPHRKIALVRSSPERDDQSYEIVAHPEVHGWLGSLSVLEAERVVKLLDHLAANGPAVNMPISRSLGSGLFEIRLRLGSRHRRITFRYSAARTIVLLTTFSKQRSNERREVTRARAAAEICRGTDS